MAYIFKQKLQISELADLPASNRKILLYEPENDLAALYVHYLKAHNFDVMHCPNLEKIKQDIAAFSPKVLIVNADGKFSHSAFGSFRDMSPQLQIISTGFNIGSEGVDKLMRAGISSHINRKLSRPEDLPILVKAILGYGSIG